MYKDDESKAELLKSKSLISSIKPASPKVAEVLSELIAILENKPTTNSTPAPKTTPTPTPQPTGFPGMGTGMPPMGMPPGMPRNHFSLFCNSKQTLTMI